VLFAVFFVVFFLLWGFFVFALPPLWDGLRGLANHAAAWSTRYGTLQRVVRHASRFRDYLPVTLIVICGLLVTLFAGDAFIDIAELVHRKSPLLQQMDMNVHAWAVAERNQTATSFFTLMSIAGGPAGLAVLVVIVEIVLLVRRRFAWAVYLASLSVGGSLLNMELKRVFARARPDIAEMLRRAHGYSFPSGHAMGSTVVFGALAYIAIRLLPRWHWRAAAAAMAITMIVSVALSRVYLGAHWISDVGAGIAAGILWVTVATVAYETFRRIRLIRALRASAGAPGNRP
jgi:undecaprenyl-diphosphatase